MATVVTYDGGLRRIEFSLTQNGPRKAVRLGRIPPQDVEVIKEHVEWLVWAKINARAVPNATSVWLTETGLKLANRLAATGLIPRRASSTLAAFVDEYIRARADVKPSTAITYGNVRRCLVEHFGDGKPLRDLTPGDADAFRLWLVTHEKLADNTVRRRLGIARQLFRAALRRGLIPTNPFDGLSASVRGNPDKFRFVTRAEADAILAECPDNPWKLIFALVRFGGLRCPSELRTMAWSDVDWARNRLTVHSPKTEHHPGGAIRQIPIFPELLPYLRDAFEEAEEGAVHVVARLRDPSVNLRTQLAKLIKRAGLVPWPKLFVNLRATRAIELRQAGFPDHVVNTWLGHTADVAAKFYLRVTESDFERAVGPEAQQKAQQSAPGGDGQQTTPQNTKCEDPLGNKREVTPSQLCASAVEEGGWAILDSNQ